jgi:hypothetical protein
MMFILCQFKNLLQGKIREDLDLQVSECKEQPAADARVLQASIGPSIYDRHCSKRSLE